MILAGAADAPLPTVRRWLRGGAVDETWAARLTHTAAQLELTGAELGPRVRLYAPPPPKPETIP